jgi:membrane protease YdiL (CAAX protease family)
LRQCSALFASLAIGVIWSLWHLPLFFMEGTYQAEQVGFLTTRFWLFAGGTLVEPVLYTWIVVNTRGSTLAAVLFHFSGNATGELVDLTARAEVLSYALSVAAVTAVIAAAGPGTLRARKRDGPQARETSEAGGNGNKGA